MLDPCRTWLVVRLAVAAALLGGCGNLTTSDTRSRLSFPIPEGSFDEAATSRCDRVFEDMGPLLASRSARISEVVAAAEPAYRDGSDFADADPSEQVSLCLVEVEHRPRAVDPQPSKILLVLQPDGSNEFVWADVPGQGPAPTQVININPFNADGSLKTGYRVDDRTGRWPVDCSYESGSIAGVTTNTHWCGATADDAHSCWAPPSRPGQLLCMFAPWDMTLVARAATHLKSTAVPKDPAPMALELSDGTLWRVRIGGSWGGRADDLRGAYSCDESSTCAYNTTGKWAAVLTDYNQPAIDKRSPTWMVMVGELGDPSTDFPPPERLAVRKAWFIASPFR